jgi:uncharacterized membrane protein YidH (DUF202 family)
VTPPPSRAGDRTTLAWSRTGFSFAAIGALIAHHAAHRSTNGLVFGLVVVVIGVAAAVRPDWRARAVLRAIEQGRSPAAPVVMAVTALLVGALAIGALAFVLTG